MLAARRRRARRRCAGSCWRRAARGLRSAGWRARRRTCGRRGARSSRPGRDHLREAVPELVEHACRVHLARAREQALELVHVDDDDRDAVELRLARGEPRVDGLEAVGVGTARRRAGGAVVMASMEVVLRSIAAGARVWTSRCAPRTECPETVTNCAGRERDAGRKNMTNGAISGRETPDSGHKKGRPRGGRPWSSAVGVSASPDHHAAIVAGVLPSSSCRRPARTHPCQPS